MWIGWRTTPGENLLGPGWYLTLPIIPCIWVSLARRSRIIQSAFSFWITMTGPTWSTGEPRNGKPVATENSISMASVDLKDFGWPAMMPCEFLIQKFLTIQPGSEFSLFISWSYVVMASAWDSTVVIAPFIPRSARIFSISEENLASSSSRPRYLFHSVSLKIEKTSPMGTPRSHISCSRYHSISDRLPCSAGPSIILRSLRGKEARQRSSRDVGTDVSTRSFQ